MIGSDGEVVKSDQGGYYVFCHGEIWHAQSDTLLTVGQKVQVLELQGLVLRVQPKEE